MMISRAQGGLGSPKRISLPSWCPKVCLALAHFPGNWGIVFHRGNKFLEGFDVRDLGWIMYTSREILPHPDNRYGNYF